MIRTVLFDMDGVLYDSMPDHARAWHETIIAQGIESNPEDYYLLEGATGGFTINYLFNRAFHRDATEEEKQTVYEQKAQRFAEINDCTRLMSGAAEVLAAVKRTGRKIVVVTGSGQSELFNNLDKNYPEMFSRELLVTAYDVTQGKPDPEPYLLGLQKANAIANEAIVIENAPLGVRAAVAAGIFTIGVNTGPLPCSVLKDAGASLIFPSMTSLAKEIEDIINEII
ncbi:MAG: HAD-IA family hydrolase [Dysgonamonadaceae bacterium]|jgi:HAD superfamily hydrolase (TIGR01509 family)|nr:HAD-IA family hydrolase [Dysgonamonadaceae bacterium]